MGVIKKIWGVKYSLLKTEQTEIDLLYLEEDSCCSIHSHKHKINRFVLLSGHVQIKSDLGDYDLEINEPFDVSEGVVHQFVIFEPSIMIELAYVEEGYIDPQDIVRKVQGGKFINEKFLTLDQLKMDDRLEL